MGKYSQALKGLSSSVDYFAQIAMRRFVASALDRMDRLSISRVKLAELLGASPSYVSRALRGDVNFTLETMTKFAMATGGRLEVRIVDSDVTNVTSSCPFNAAEHLRNESEIAAYIEAMLEEGDAGAVPVALRTVAEAVGGMAALAQKTGLSRETLYRTLSGRGNPRLDTLAVVLAAFGLRLAVRPVQGKSRSSKRRETAAAA